MLLSILANLIGIWGLISLPAIVVSTIDLSDFPESGAALVKGAYLREAPYRLNNFSLGVKLTAPSAMAVDKKTGFVLWQKNPAEVRSLASITKLLTALVFLDHNPGWETEITIQLSDYREGGRIRVFDGERLYVKDLFNASLIASSNNATVALARSTGLGEEEFAAAMNQKAEELGMFDSKFFEPTGLDPANVSTPADIIRLARAALGAPEIALATSQPEYTFKVINAPRTYTLENTDRLLNSYLDIAAGKTGFLDEAGYCLISEVKGPEGQEILVVVMGSASEETRFTEVKALAQWAFDNYRWPTEDD